MTAATDGVMVSVLSIDAWRNTEGGWDWNQWFTVSRAPIEWADLPPRAFLRRMRDIDALSPGSRGRVAVEDDGYNMVVIERGTREPLIALAYGEAIP